MRDVATTLALLPVLIPQALWVRFRAARLQEAAGPRKGQAGQGPPLRVLVIGDSSGAGVGVPTQDEALAGRLVAHLAPHRRVTWRLEARCGATTATLLDRLGGMPAQEFDVAVIALGVNDSKNGMSRAQWRRNYHDLITLLQTRFGVPRIYASGLPPLGHFPLLPKPLRGVLGRRAAHFDDDLRALLAEREGLHHVPLDFPMNPDLMASDGFHPGPVVYDGWAQRIAQRIL